MTFDLENARAADEVLPYPLDAKEIWVSGKGQMHINLPNAPSIFFTLSDLCEFRNIFHGQAAEIERLRAEISEQKGMIWKTQQVKKEQYAQIKELKADLEQSEWSRRLRLDVIDQRAARIKELEADNQNLVTLNKSLMNNDWILRDNNRKYRKRAQKAELLNKELKSKIGPDADAKPHCWQITEERKAAIDRSMRFLSWANAKTNKPEIDIDLEVLRAMLTEAGQE